MPIKTPEDRKAQLAKLGSQFLEESKYLKRALTAFSKVHKVKELSLNIAGSLDTLQVLMVTVRTHLIYLAEPVKKPRAKKKKPTVAKVLRPAKTGKVTAAQARKAVKNAVTKKKRKK